MTKKIILKNAMMMMFAKKRQVKASRSSNEKPNAKRKHVPTPASGQTESFLSEMTEAISTLKTLGADTSSKEVLDFLKE